jgi:hypothetical protein
MGRNQTIQLENRKILQKTCHQIEHMYKKHMERYSTMTTPPDGKEEEILVHCWWELILVQLLWKTAFFFLK